MSFFYIYICFVYIPHEKSTYYNLNECDFFYLIEEVIFYYTEKGNILVCGDFNSIVGLLNDTLLTDNLDRYIESVGHDESPTIPQMDATVN